MHKLLCTKIFILLLSFLSSLPLQAQSFTKGNNIVSAGYGLGTFTNLFIPSYARYLGLRKSVSGPFYLKYERAITERLGFGLNVAYMHIDASFQNRGNNLFGYKGTLYHVKIGYDAFSVLARVNYHFLNSKKLDPYIGVGLGYRQGNWTASYQFLSGEVNEAPEDLGLKSIFPIGFEATLGCRYLITDYFGIYSELGFAKSVFQAGVSGIF